LALLRKAKRKTANPENPLGFFPITLGVFPAFSGLVMPAGRAKLPHKAG
jgi:hypothetical protein